MRRALQSIVAALAVVVLFAGAAAAQRANSLEDGAWALQFGIEGEFISVNSFAGGVSLKRHFSPKSAFRVGVSANGGDNNIEYSAVDDKSGGDNWGTGVNVIYQRYVRPDADALLYWGLGPTFSYGRSSFEQSRGDSLSTSQTHEMWSVGADAMLGVEWFATRVISFQAEYVARIDYRSETEIRESTLNGGVVYWSEATRDGWSSALVSAVRFGLSVYF